MNSSKDQRVCPYYQLPQLVLVRSRSHCSRRPQCQAISLEQDLEPETIARLCRTPGYHECARYQAKIESDVFERLASIELHVESGVYERMEPSELEFVSVVADDVAPREPEVGTLRRLAISALWVLGIPAAITFFILLAAWLTEHVWIATQTIIR